MTRPAIYTRISKDSAEGAGVRRQEAECRELVERRGWGVPRVFKDNDVSATSGRKRPAFEDLKQAVRAGEVDAVVAWHQDRLWRTMGQDTLDLMELAREHSLPIAFVASPDIDMTTPDGEMVATILTATATAEVRRASVRQKARWRQRKKDGRESNLGRRPFGFDRVGDEGSRRLAVNRKEAKAVQEAARNLIAGQSLYRVAREMPLPPPYAAAWRPNHLRRMFEKDLFTRHGVLTDDEDRLVKARLEAAPKNPPGRPRRTYALSGLAVCGLCGQKLAASSGQFHCQPPGCGRVGIKADLLDRTVADRLTDHLPSEDELRTGSPEKLAEDEAAALRELADIEARIEKLADDLALDEAVLKRRTRALTVRRDELIEQLGRPRTTPGIAWDWIARWAETGNPLTGDDREFLRTLIERVVVQPAAKRGSKKFDPSRAKITWR